MRWRSDYDRSGDHAKNFAGCLIILLAPVTLGLSLLAVPVALLVCRNRLLGRTRWCPVCRAGERYDAHGVRIA